MQDILNERYIRIKMNLLPVLKSERGMWLQLALPLLLCSVLIQVTLIQSIIHYFAV